MLVDSCLSIGYVLLLLKVSGGTKRATFVNAPLLRLQSSEGKFTMSHEIEPVRRSLRRSRSCTFMEVARLVPSGLNNPPSSEVVSSRTDRTICSLAKADRRSSQVKDQPRTDRTPQNPPSQKMKARLKEWIVV